MQTAAKILAPLALLTTLAAPLLFFFQALGESGMKTALLLATVVWFTAAPFWMRSDTE